MAENWQKIQGEIFRLCYRRAKRAVRSGFYLEGITLSETLILNRIEAVLRDSAGVRFDRFSVGKALRGVESHKIEIVDRSLVSDTWSWVDVRNDLSHHFSRVVVEEGLVWRLRLRKAREAAELGIQLANRWSKESRNHKI